MIDVVTRGDHQDLVFATLEAGKHCLVEKPVCHDYRDVLRADELARSKGLKTKVGLTFRYAPAVMYMFDLIREGFVGDPFIFNGFEQIIPDLFTPECEDDDIGRYWGSWRLIFKHP